MRDAAIARRANQPVHAVRSFHSQTVLEVALLVTRTAKSGLDTMCPESGTLDPSEAFFFRDRSRFAMMSPGTFFFRDARVFMPADPAAGLRA